MGELGNNNANGPQVGADDGIESVYDKRVQCFIGANGPQVGADAGIYSIEG
jgi:hypothetical protein